MSHTDSGSFKAAFALASVIALSALPARAETVDNLVTFNAGTTARAADVNANFAAVAAAIDGNDAAIAQLSGTVGAALNERSTYVPAGTDGVANGQALLAAIGAVGVIPGNETPWSIVLHPGLYDLEGGQLILPANVHLIGSGARRTRIEGNRVAPGVAAEGAIVVGAAGTLLADVAVANREAFGGVAVAVYSDESIRVYRCDIGQNLAVAGATADSYGLVGTFMTVEESSLLGFAGGAGVGVGVTVRGGGSIRRSVLQTQGSNTGAAIIVDAAATTDTTVSQTLIRGFGSGQGFIHNADRNLTIVFSEFVQTGLDGSANAGNVRIGASMRGNLMSVMGGATITCAQNFTPAMATLAGC